MKVIKMEEVNLKEPLSLAIGFFDGLHLGHMSLINEVLKQKGQKQRCQLTCRTFAYIQTKAECTQGGRLFRQQAEQGEHLHC